MTTQTTPKTPQTLVRVGAGKAVHSTYIYRGDLCTVCGAEGRGSGQVRWGYSELHEATGPVTCKRCLAMTGGAS